MIPKTDIGQMPVNMVNELLENSSWPDKVTQKFTNQWFVMRKRAVDMEKFLMGLRRQTSAAVQVDAHVSSTDGR